MITIKKILGPICLLILIQSCTSSEIISINTTPSVIAFIFDDGWESDYKVVKPIFDERNIKCGFAIVKRWIGAKNHLDIIQIKKLNSEGFEIISHSINHFKMQSGEIDPFKIINEISDSKIYLESLGCDVYGWVTPMSIMNDKYIPILYGYDYAFTKSNGFNPIDETNPLKQTRFGLESTSLDNAKNTVDKAHRENKPIVFYAHNVMKDTQEEKDLISLIDYCISKDYPIVTPNELIAHYHIKHL